MIVKVEVMRIRKCVVSTKSQFHVYQNKDAQAIQEIKTVKPFVAGNWKCAGGFKCRDKTCIPISKRYVYIDYSHSIKYKVNYL